MSDDRPLVLIDPWPRRRDMIFSDADWARLTQRVRIVESPTDRLDDATIDALLPETVAIIGQTELTAERLARAPHLKAVFNVVGNLLGNIDYAALFAQGAMVQNIGPVFALPVAELALGLALDLARGVTVSDRAIRTGTEIWTHDGNRESFLLTHSSFGLIGFGAVGRALLPLLRPFHGTVRIHDPWLPDATITEAHAIPSDLESLLSESRVIFVLAGVTAENTGFLNRAMLERIRSDAVFVLVSRAAVVEFDALLDLVEAGRFRAAVDVYPVEPLAPDARARRIERLLVTPHRAGGIPSAYTAIGAAVVDDLDLVLRGLPPQRTQSARPQTAARMRSSSIRRAIPGESR